MELTISNVSPSIDLDVSTLRSEAEMMEDRFDDCYKLLQVFSLYEVLEALDLTEEEVLNYLVTSEYIKWEELIDAIPLPVTCIPGSIGNDEYETSELND